MATTEPHRIPATIISRCQRFDLARISTGAIADKLQEICKDLGREATPEALRLIAHRAEGGLRDAESLLDQLLSYSPTLSIETVTQQLGLTPRRYFFSLDEHFSRGDAAYAFQLTGEIMDAGYDPQIFLENLAEHYRLLLMLKYDPSAIQSQHFDCLESVSRASYVASAAHYTLEQCLFILDLLVEWLQKIARTPHLRIALECILMTILRSRNRVSLDVLVRRLEEMEIQIQQATTVPAQPTDTPPKSVIEKTPAAKIEVAVEKKLNVPEDAPEEPQVAEDEKHPSHYENIVHFAAVELEGNIKIHNIHKR